MAVSVSPRPSISHDDASRVRTERHPHANLLRPLSRDVGHHPIDTCHRETQRDGGEETQ